MIPKKYTKFIENAVNVLSKDTRIVGLATGGSYITKEMDDYSDVDIVVAIDSLSYEEVLGKRNEIACEIGELLSAFTGEHVGEPRLLICLYGEELLHVDLKFVDIKDIHHRVENPVILWERESCITEELKKSKAEFPIPSLQWVEDRFWVWIHYAGTKIGRGEIFEAVDFTSFLRQMAIGPLILMKNEKLPRGVRKIEFDAKDSIEDLKETIPTYDKDSCVKAIEKIIEMYLDLREDFITEDFVRREKAQILSIKYLNDIAKSE